MKILLIACLVFLIPCFSSGENSAAFFRCYYDELNLPQTTILSIDQDSKGYIWLATGGKNGCFNSEVMQVLKGREVTLIPDLGATEQWKEKSALLSGICKRVVVSNVLECTSDEEQRSQGLDIADFFLYSPSKRQILHQMIQRNPALQLLIDELDLELIE